MKRLPIHARLTAYYLCSLVIIVTLFAAGCWYAMKSSMYDSIDRDLSYRMKAVVPFLRSHSLNTVEDFDRSLDNAPGSFVVGVFLQITDSKSTMLYQSDVLTSHDITTFAAPNADGSISWSVANEHGWTVRVASQQVVVDNIVLYVHVVEPLKDTLNSLHELAMYLFLMIPTALALTAAAGYWISRLALAPVEQIRQEADAIDPTDLTTRLAIPESNDELSRLAQTLNSMLSRIEAGFRSVEQFTADASHELRAPLAFIITTGDVSLRRQRSPEETREAMGKILREARRMTTLIENLLTLARGDVQHDKGRGEAVNLAVVIHEVFEQRTMYFSAKGIHFEVELPDTSMRINGIASDLQRLLHILADNALKYTDAGVVRITLTEEPDFAMVTVADTGIGIESSELSYIFHRFWRADKVRSRAEGGVGLGLSIANQIVRRHHGTITVESVPGKGSSFILKFPKINPTESVGFSDNFQIHPS